jgi:hypothetical protein
MQLQLANSVALTRHSVCHAQSSSLVPLRFRDFVLGLCEIRAVGKSGFRIANRHHPNFHSA